MCGPFFFLFFPQLRVCEALRIFELAAAVHVLLKAHAKREEADGGTARNKKGVCGVSV